MLIIQKMLERKINFFKQHESHQWGARCVSLLSGLKIGLHLNPIHPTAPSGLSQKEEACDGMVARMRSKYAPLNVYSVHSWTW